VSSSLLWLPRPRRILRGTVADLQRLQGQMTAPAPGAAPYFTEDFESAIVGANVYNRGANGFLWLPSYNGTGAGSGIVRNDVSHSGTKSLGVTYLAGHEDFDQPYQLKPLGQGLHEFWMEWWLWFPPEYVYQVSDTPNNNKLFYCWAETYSVTSDLNSGTEYQGTPTSAPYVVAHVGSLRSAPQGVDQSNGDANTDHYNIFNPSSIAGSWHRLRSHNRAATPNGAGGYSDNGTYQVWFDTTLIVQSHPGYTIYTTIGAANNWWRGGYLLGNANAPYLVDTHFAIDDVSVWDQAPDWGVTFT